jgi:NAD(P)-dependent dehydrogenase (short-subunit alcohol dehydrogenase family)
MEEKESYILVTGSSSGIGRNVAINLSRNYNVVLHGRNQQRLQETKSLCSEKFHTLVLELDLSRTEEIENAVSKFITDNSIEISGFVHCAGLLKMLPLKMLNLEDINLTFATNVISAFMLVKVLIKKKINNSALKNIIFISSNISNFGAKAFTAYGASKGALDSLMRCLAVELAPDVRVNSVLPGAIQTEMSGEVFENTEVIERMAKIYPLGMGKPEDIFGVVEFLLSEKSRWITGQQFTVDGGRTINISG